MLRKETELIERGSEWRRYFRVAYINAEGSDVKCRTDTKRSNGSPTASGWLSFCIVNAYAAETRTGPFSEAGFTYDDGRKRERK